MNPLTHEWIQKAEEDFEAAQRLSRSRTIPLWNAVCFHAQQCAEKYLKACLQEEELALPGLWGGFFIGSYAHAHFNRSFKRVV